MGKFWHGSTDKNFEGKQGIHVGTYKAASQALQARIGLPAEGVWDGTREYGKTLLAGKKTIETRSKELGYSAATGFNCFDVPEEDYYPADRERKAKYSDGTSIPMDCRPIVFPVYVVGRMANSTSSPMSDTMANSKMLSLLRQGKSRSGYYYVNDGEDPGSISAVVPNGSFLMENGLLKFDEFVNENLKR